jgi:hypothetical protein
MRLFTAFLGALTFATSAAAQSFSLHIETSQSQFRIGEAIGLKAVFEMTQATDVPHPGIRDGWSC